MKKQFTKLLTAMLCILSLVALCFGMAACGAKIYQVTLDYDGEQGSVTLSPAAEGNKYEEGTKVTVSVTATEGYEIDTFTVSTDANAKLADGKYELTVSADTTVKATFKTTEIAVSGITLTPDTLALEVGGRTEDATATLVATVEPADATDKTVTWTSSDPTVATVEGGNVTALAAGETTITATAGGKSATCVVTVTQHVHKAAEGAEWKQDTENNQHYKECVCGEHVEVGAHSAKDDTYYQDEENNKHYQLCVCGEKVNESEHNLKINADKTKFECEQCDYEEAHTHDTQLQDAGESGHKTVCKTEGCGYESAVTAHSAKDATYQQDTENNKHYQLCECGARVNEAAHGAAEGAEWKQDTENNQHYKECVCGEHVEVGAHSAKDATYQQDTENNKHYQLCECGAKVNEAEHSAADEEEWEHDEGDKTTGKHWQLCVCGEKVNEGTHEMDPEAFSDGAAGHHYECEQCGFKTETEEHVNESGKWTQHSDFNVGHYYNCSVCEAEVTQKHTIVRYSNENGLYRKCQNCDLDEFISAHEMTKLVSDGDAGTHHFECDSVQHRGLGCEYKSESVSCASDEYMTWTQVTENPSSGHVGTCQCGNQVSVQPHDTNGDDGKCSKCGYKDAGEHQCKDDPVNGFYDGICDICGKNFNNTWSFTASTGTITKYNGTYTKVIIPKEIDGTTVKTFSAGSSGTNGFNGNTTLTDVIVSIDELPAQAFRGCTNLVSVVILSDKITTIGAGTFNGCSALKTIVLPRTIATINGAAFGAASAINKLPADFHVTFYFMGTKEQWQTAYDASATTSAGKDTPVRTVLDSKSTTLYFGASENGWYWEVENMIPHDGVKPAE